MGSPSKRNFVLVAIGAALLIAAVANLVANSFVDEPLNWFPSLLTAVVVGAFVALIVFRPRKKEHTEFTIDARREEGRSMVLETKKDE